jgi:hypothetical protein
MIFHCAMERRKELASVTFSIRPDRCTIENLRQFDQLFIHIDYSIGQHHLTSDGERGHRCPRTDSPLGRASWFEGRRPSPRFTFDPAANALKNRQMFSMPGLLIWKSVREFVDLSQQRMRVAHPRRESRGNISQMPVSVDHRKEGWGERRREKGRRTATVELRRNNPGCGIHPSRCSGRSILGRTEEGLSKPVREL